MSFNNIISSFLNHLLSGLYLALIFISMLSFVYKFNQIGIAERIAKSDAVIKSVSFDTFTMISVSDIIILLSFIYFSFVHKNSP